MLTYADRYQIGSQVYISVLIDLIYLSSYTYAQVRLRVVRGAAALFFYFYSLFSFFRLFCASCEVLLSFGALGEHVGHDYDLLTQVWTYAEVCWRVLTYADVS